MKEKTVILNKERNVVLTCFPVGQNKPAVLICPGGGYNECSVSEGKPVAEKFNSLGFNAFVLCYSVGKNYKWPYPLEDFENAMAYIKANGKQFSVDTEHIVAAGFSAGGHLVSYAASKAENKPYAAIILYGAAKAQTINYTAPDAPDAVEAVNLYTCPCFLAASRNDWIVPVNNTLEYIEALNKNYIDYELHIYGYSMHGFSIGEEVGAKPPLFCSRVGDWVEESVSWINDLISGRYISIRENSEYNDKYSKTLSSKNSCKIIFENPQAKNLFKKKFLPQYLLYEATKKKVGSFVDGVSLKNVLSFLKVKDETFKKIDEALKVFKKET